MARGIHQLLPTLHRGDAMGDHTMALQRLFQSWGFESSIFASALCRDAPSNCHASIDFERLVGANDIAILHYGVYSWELRPFCQTPARRVLVYHNITPPSFFLNYGLRHYYGTAIGRLELPKAVAAAEQSWTPSLYNKRELDALGATDARVVPLLLDLNELDRIEPHPDVTSRYDDGDTNVVFVGRIAPNKRQDNVISAFARYRRDHNPRSRLLLVGSYEGLEYYHAQLQAHCQRLHVEDAVVFTGRVTGAELVAYYRVAHVFLCLSEHEGFAVPLVEAMHFGVPVVALARAAVPGTLGDAGILLPDLDVDDVAVAVQRAVHDGDVRTGVLASQRRRLQDFRPEKVAAMLRMYVDELQT